MPVGCLRGGGGAVALSRVEAVGPGGSGSTQSGEASTNRLHVQGVEHARKGVGPMRESRGALISVDGSPASTSRSAPRCENNQV